MKKLLFILITIPLIFGSCEEEDNTPSVSPPPPTSSVTTGYISTQDGVMFKTTDSGVTWTYLSGLNDYIQSNWGGV
jgi:hypothetical protein